jgi:hypothetical protein
MNVVPPLCLLCPALHVKMYMSPAPRSEACFRTRKRIRRNDRAGVSPFQVPVPVLLSGYSWSGGVAGKLPAVGGFGSRGSLKVN